MTNLNQTTDSMNFGFTGQTEVGEFNTSVAKIPSLPDTIEILAATTGGAKVRGLLNTVTGDIVIEINGAEKLRVSEDGSTITDIG